MMIAGFQINRSKSQILKLLFTLVLFFLSASANGQPAVNYYSIGEGEPLILINGGPGWSSYHMKPVAGKLAEMGYKIILFDQRGTGNTKMKIDSTTIKFGLMVEDIEEIRKELKASSLIVYGHSFGGMLAMAYATEYPGRVKKLILSAPGGCDLSFLDYYQTNLNYALSPAERKAVREWSDPAKIQEDPGQVSYNLIKNTISSFLFNKHLIDSVMTVIDEDTWNIQTGNLVWQNLIAINYDLKPFLHKIKSPVLIIQGRQDALGEVNPVKISQLIPNSKLVFLERSAHLMWLDRPEEYYRNISEFLKQLNSK